MYILTEQENNETAVPNLCYYSLRLHVIKIGAGDIFKCQKQLWNHTKWTYIHNNTKLPIIHRECFDYIYNDSGYYNVSKEISINSDKGYNCKFYTRNIRQANNSILSIFIREFSNYCDSLNYELYYDVIGNIIPFILGCFLFTPFADIYGRHRILAIASHWFYVAVFLKIFFLYFTRESIGDGLLNFAYSPLKYATQAIVIEIAGNTLRPIAFVISFLGMHIPPAIAYYASPLYWRYLLFIAYSPVLFLPLFLWLMPESPTWLFSKKQVSASNIVSKTLNDAVAHDNFLVVLCNKKMYLKDFKEFFQDLKKNTKKEFISINTLAICIGFSWFYSYSKHKLMFSYVENEIFRIGYPLSGFIGTVLSIPCVYYMNVCKILIASLLLINGILFAILLRCSLDSLELGTFLLIFLIEIISVILVILFEFYVHQIFPTSHRCTCTAVCGISTAFGLIVLVCLRKLLNASVAEAVSSIMCILGSIHSVFTVRNLKPFNPLVLNFNEFQEHKLCTFRCMKF